MIDTEKIKTYKYAVQTKGKLYVQGYINYSDTISIVVSKKFFDTKDILNLQSIDGFSGLKSREDGTEIMFNK
jgi:hypothetical protein